MRQRGSPFWNRLTVNGPVSPCSGRLADYSPTGVRYGGFSVFALWCFLVFSRFLTRANAPRGEGEFVSIRMNKGRAVMVLLLDDGV